MLGTLSTLGSHLASTRQQQTLQGLLDKSGQELTTGKVSNVTEELEGATMPLSLLSRKAELLASYQSSARQAGLRVDAMQSALGQIVEQATDLRNDMATVDQFVSSDQLNGLSQNAENAFRATVSLLNSEISGAYLFSGSATNNPSLVSADEMLDALRVEIAGSSDVATFEAAIDAWFDSPTGGFATSAYLGSQAGNVEFSLSNTRSVEIGVRSDVAALKTALKEMAKAALSTDTGTALDIPSQHSVLRDVNSTFSNAVDGILQLRDSIGQAQSQINHGEQQIEMQLSDARKTLSERTARDPFEAATDFQQAEQSLSLLYETIARRSNLSLARYLR